jgi:hypothetical protein
MKVRRRIAAPEAQGLCHGRTQLQQGFATGEMGFRGKLARQQFSKAHVRFVPKADRLETHRAQTSREALESTPEDLMRLTQISTLGK